MKAGLHWYLGAAVVVLGFTFEEAKAADIKGVVTGPKGPEAGVWVIAETTDLPTKYAKVVVTDDQGRYLIPDLPKANYSVWARGYGLKDSAKTKSAPRKTVHLKAAAAHAVGTGVDPNGDRPRLHGDRRCAEELRRLDRPRRGGRAALRQARAAAGRGTQHGGHHVGFLDAEILSARRHLDRPGQSAAQPQRPDLRRARGGHPQPSGARPRQGPGVHDQAPGHQPQDPVLDGIADAALALLGQGAAVGRP